MKPIADGRIFSGRQAMKLKLVDAMGGIDEAVADAAKLGGVTGEPKLAYPKKKKPFLRDILSNDEDEDAETLFHGLARGVLKALDEEGSGLRFRSPLAPSIP